MTTRYRMPLFAQTINVGQGRLDASPDGWFYPRSPAEESALVAAGCVLDDTASGTTPRPITTESPEFQALMSGDGNFASADVPIVQGAYIGDTRRIADGSDRGALLIWAVPEGSSTPTWCWWLWPQSAYTA